MAKFKIEEPGKADKWVKNIDRVNQAIEFTTDEAEAYVRDGGFYPGAELNYIKHYFMEEHPELEYCKVVDGWD